MYEPPEVHTPGTSLRTIVSFVNSPIYALSKYVVSIWSPLVGKSPFQSSLTTTDFDSYNPLAHKVAVVGTLLTQADWICSNSPNRDVEKKQVAGALSNSGYPTGLVKNWQPSPH